MARARYALVNLHIESLRWQGSGLSHVITQHCFAKLSACPIDSDTVEVMPQHNPRTIALDLAEVLVMGGSAREVRVYFRGSTIGQYTYAVESSPSGIASTMRRLIMSKEGITGTILHKKEGS